MYKKSKNPKKRSNPGKSGTLFLVGGLAILGYFAYKRGKTPQEKAGKANVINKLQPAQVKSGELVAAQSYRIISGRRAGMNYVAADGNIGGEVSFTPSGSGKFTRNVVQEGGRLWAEIA